MRDTEDPGTIDLFPDLVVAKPRHDASMVGPAQHLRSAGDFYETEAWVTKVILRHVMLHRVWEPACGAGAMSRVLEAAGVPVVSTDLYDRDYGTPGVDFLDQTEMRDGTTEIVTNPPFFGKLPDRFVRHALALTEPVKGRVVMVLRNEWDAAARRTGLFGNMPFAQKIVLTKRPRWIKGSTGAPRHNYAIYVWDWRQKSAAKITYDQ